MKKIILSLVCLAAFVSTAQAQYFEKDSVFKNDHITVAGSQDFDVHMQITNPSDFKNYTWRREIISIPANWTTAICDIFLCHDANTSTGKFFMNKGESGTFFSHFYMPDNSGGYSKVRVILENDSTNIADTATFSINIWNSLLDIETLNAQQVIVYPNPSNGNFKVKGNNIEEIVITTPEGKEVLVISASEITNENEIDIETDLPNGLFLVKVKQAGNTTTKKIIVTD